MNIEKSVTLSKPSSRAFGPEARTAINAAESASICAASLAASWAGMRTLLMVTRTGVCNPNLIVRAMRITFMPRVKV